MNSIPGEIEKIRTVIGFLLDSVKFKYNMYNRIENVRLRRGMSNNPIEERSNSGKSNMGPSLPSLPGAIRENADPNKHLLPGKYQDFADPHLYIL